MPFWLAAGAIGGALIGAVSQKKTNKANAELTTTTAAADRVYNNQVRAEDRAYFLSDRTDDRSYLAQLTSDDRRYAADVLSDDRAYYEATRSDERAYMANLLADDRDYLAGITASDRSYSEARLAGDRQYMEGRADVDRQQYLSDRDLMQSRSDQYVDQSAASRGIDFTRLRDDAVKAGYNPMTALSMAHAYSTHRDYQVVGGPHSNALAGAVPSGAVPMAQAAAGGGGGGGVSPPSGGIVQSHVPAGGGFVSPGSGYQTQVVPAMSSGAFLADAFERGVDTVFNRPHNDELADALRTAIGSREAAEAASATDFTRNFGYSLTKQEPFRPTVAAGVPPLASADYGLTPRERAMPTGEVQRGGKKFVPVQSSDGKFINLEASVARRLGIEPFDTLAPGDEAEIYGEVQEVLTAANNPGIRRNLTPNTGRVGNIIQQGPRIGERIRDYMESGITGVRGLWQNAW